MNNSNEKSSLHDLHDELWNRFGVFIELTGEILEHARLPKKNLRLLGRWIDFLDYKIELEFPHKKLPKIVQNRLRLVDNALESIGFTRPFSRFANWPWNDDSDN
jgi:hypothetical protein